MPKCCLATLNKDNHHRPDTDLSLPSSTDEPRISKIETYRRNGITDGYLCGRVKKKKREQGGNISDFIHVSITTEPTDPQLKWKTMRMDFFRQTLLQLTADPRYSRTEKQWKNGHAATQKVTQKVNPFVWQIVINLSATSMSVANEY